MQTVSASTQDELNQEFTGSEITASLEVLPRLDCLAAMWRDLERRADASYFLSWDWIGTWLAEACMQPLLMIGRRVRPGRGSRTSAAKIKANRSFCVGESLVKPGWKRLFRLR